MKILPGNGGQTTLADNETKRGVKKKKKELDFAATNGAPYKNWQHWSSTTIGLWHEIQNRLKNTWFDVVFHADSDSIFF